MAIRRVPQRKPSADLKRYLDTKKKETVVLGSIDRMLLTRAPDTSRRTDVLHPSELSGDWCARASYHLLLGVTPKSSPPGLRLQSIFDTGHAIHARWQQRIGELGVLYGMWMDEEGLVGWGTGPGDYLEVPLDHDSMMIQGHADGWILDPSGDYLLEVKSIGIGTVRKYDPSLLRPSLSATFKEISRPFSAHIRQAFLYIHCLRDMHHRGLLEMPPPDRVLFLYECKEDQSAREFVVEYDQTHIQAILDRVHDLVMFFKEGVEPTCDLPSGCAHCQAVGL